MSDMMYIIVYMTLKDYIHVVYVNTSMFICLIPILTHMSCYKYRPIKSYIS